jgi:hypothetical protein
MKTIILTDRAGFEGIIGETRSQWLSDLLIYIGIDETDVSGMSKDTMVEYFMRNNLEIINYPSIGALSVSHEGDVIGEWAGPEMTMKEDPSGDLYYEVVLEHWSIAEEEIFSNDE